MTKKMTNKEIIDLFQEQVNKGNVSHYKKNAKVLWRKPLPGETIITTCGGKVETIRTILPGEDYSLIVVMNIQVGTSAERYVIDKEKFYSRYILCDRSYSVDGHRWELARGKGEVDGFCYPGDIPFAFVAPWGEDMLLCKGDMLVRTIGSEDDIYRIARNEFDMTYDILEGEE
jgi:hypothetical protein